MGEIKMIEIAYEFLQFRVLFVIKKEPFYLPFIVPFSELTDLSAHKGQLFAGVSHDICHEGSCACEFHFIIARHLIKERLLAVNDLIMRDGQNKFFIEGIEHGECKLVMDVLPEKRIGLYIFQKIVHPSHIPFKGESETGISFKAGYISPSRGFLGNHHNVGIFIHHI